MVNVAVSARAHAATRESGRAAVEDIFYLVSALGVGAELARPDDRVLAPTADLEVLCEHAGPPEPGRQVDHRELRVVGGAQAEGAHDAVGREPLAERTHRGDGRRALPLLARARQDLEERVAEASLRLPRDAQLEAAARGGHARRPRRVTPERLEARQRGA